MRLQLLPSTIDPTGKVSGGQHFTCFVIDDRVAIDAGSLATSVSDAQRENIRDVLLTHAHLDHIAGLPLFIDDLFANLDEPVRVHARREVIEVLERDVFNWAVYPRFSELRNANGPVLEYREIGANDEFGVAHLKIRSVDVNHKVTSSGFVVEHDDKSIALSGDTAEMDAFWELINGTEGLSALLIECAFPNDLGDLADISHHLTPDRLARELDKFRNKDCPVYVVNLKPMYREMIIAEIRSLRLSSVEILEVGRIYEF